MHRKRILWIAVFSCVVLAVLAFSLLHRPTKTSPEQPRAAAVVDVVAET